jgi:NADPH:quinone reductase-like Zn-dependent oxidoreductase
VKAYELGDRKGGALTLHRVERPDPVPGHGEAVMKVHATGLGARDLSIMKSAWPPAEKRAWQNPPPPERIPLQDGAGEVIAVGPGETVLTLGSGNVSVFGLQIAKALGARVIVTSSSDDKLAKLRALGAGVGINYRSHPDWHREVLAQTGGRGADVVLNTIGYPTLEKCLLACASNARVMHIGARPVIGASAEPATFTQLPNLISKCITIKGFTVASRRMFEDFVRALEVNRIKPVIDRVFGFDQVLDAIRYYESGAKIGKVVIKVH